MYSTGEDMILPTLPEQFVVGPKWWQQITGILGLPFEFIVQIAGTTDSGKSSSAIEFARCAQEQDVVLIWADTEGKTTKMRFTQWGVDPSKMLLLKPKTLEDMYDGIDEFMVSINADNPKTKVLFILDSLGNTVSEKELESSIHDPVQMGKRANINNRGFSRLISMMRTRGNFATLVINQTYDNMGSPGKQNKGGKNKDFFSAITFQTSRIGWLEGTKNGEKYRKGAKCKWNLFKHHLIDNDSSMGKTFELDITKDGIALKGEVPDKYKAHTGDVVIDEETGEILE